MIKTSFDARYKELMKGKVQRFSLGEIGFMLENLNSYMINTLCIQKTDSEFYCAVDDKTKLNYDNVRRRKMLETAQKIQKIGE